ncbi:MAG: hypothetical protein DRQ39_04310 [Gammaproteobacteria bacterium]|nr:MAG: hypothetical protein DRQ39_04310 [Gammaproteobacteria bacterium]
MSDYYGIDTLESWLENELFTTSNIPAEVVKLFERWRDPIESSVGSWMDSDDGDGNHLSWRGWGRGYAQIPDEDSKALDEAIRIGTSIIKKVQEDTLTTRAFAMAAQENCDSEEYDMIQELAGRVVELERRIGLVRELKYANLPGFIDDALNGIDVKDMRFGSPNGSLRLYLDNIKQNEY